ncbi:MAG: Hpt domain-containing protein [Gemmobacter sp.]
MTRTLAPTERRAVPTDGGGLPQRPAATDRTDLAADDPGADSRDGLDTALLPALLARLGPAVALDLRRQLDADLGTLRAALVGALGPPPDTAALSRQAHVLVGLAGTAGGHGLAVQARRLLQVAQRGDQAGSARLTLALLPAIDRLQRFAATCAPPAGCRP